jgi:hypothetical protein
VAVGRRFIQLPLSVMKCLARWLPHLLVAALPLCAQTPEWRAVDDESMRHFQALVRMDTSDPPGNELPAVEYKRCSMPGIYNEVLTRSQTPEPGGAPQETERSVDSDYGPHRW